MPRVLSIKRHFKKLRRKYSKITPYRYFYNRKTDLNLRKKFSEIVVWFLIHDVERGHSIFTFNYRRKILSNIAEWRKRFTKTIEGYEPLMTVFTQSVLPAINNKTGANWQFKTLIGWTGFDLSKVKHSNPSSKRNKPVKGKHATKSNSNRR